MSDGEKRLFIAVIYISGKQTGLFTQDYSTLHAFQEKLDPASGSDLFDKIHEQFPYIEKISSLSDLFIPGFLVTIHVSSDTPTPVPIEGTEGEIAGRSFWSIYPDSANALYYILNQIFYQPPTKAGTDPAEPLWEGIIGRFLIGTPIGDAIGTIKILEDTYDLVWPRPGGIHGGG